jgi:hypothetical protein
VETRAKVPELTVVGLPFLSVLTFESNFHRELEATYNSDMNGHNMKLQLHMRRANMII